MTHIGKKSLNTESDTEINIEEIEAEIGSRSKTFAGELTIFSLAFTLEVEAEGTERNMESDILHNEDLQARGEIERSLDDISVGITDLAIERADKIVGTILHAEGNFIEKADTATARESDILCKSKSAGVRVRTIRDIMEVEIDILIDIDIERVDIAACGIITEFETDREVIADKILEIWLNAESMG